MWERPEGKVAARGVSHHQHPRKVEAVFARNLTDEIKSRGCILERVRPASTGRSYAAVFHRPAGYPFTRQCRAQISGVTKVVF
jgi:hypothetical protein